MNWLIDWLIDWLMIWLDDWADWVGRMVGMLVSGLVGCLVQKLAGSLLDEWAARCLVGWWSFCGLRRAYRYWYWRNKCDVCISINQTETWQISVKVETLLTRALFVGNWRFSVLIPYFTLRQYYMTAVVDMWSEAHHVVNWFMEIFLSHANNESGESE